MMPLPPCTNGPSLPARPEERVSNTAAKTQCGTATARNGQQCEPTCDLLPAAMVKVIATTNRPAAAAHLRSAPLRC